MKYTISGEPFPYLSCTLEAGEQVICQKGAMIWMTENMKMDTSTGGLGKIVTKAFTGESIFHNTYTAMAESGHISFGAGCPGKILPFSITPNSSIIAQKGAFLASETGVNFEAFLQKKISAGFFGGEGFVLQKFTGNGMLFLEIDGSVVEYDLEPGASLLVDTGYLAAMEDTVSISIEKVKGIGNALFGGEGFFNTRLTGPGHIWLQTMPVNQLAGMLYSHMPLNKA